MRQVTLPISGDHRRPGTDIAALVAEPPLNGPAEARGEVVLVPGFTGSKEDFLGLLPDLARQGWRVTAYDQRGQFESAGRRGPGVPAADEFTRDALAADLLQVVEQVSPDGAPVHLLGHSFGGLVTTAAVVAEPGRFASLTLMCSGPGAMPEHKHAGMNALIAALEALEIEQVWAAMTELERANGAIAPPPDVDAFLKRRFTSNDPVALVAKGRELLGADDRVDDLKRACAAHQIPVAVLLGENDDVWWPQIQRDTASRLLARVIVIDDAGHSPQWDRPSATAGALQSWLHWAHDPTHTAPTNWAGSSRVAASAAGYSSGVSIRQPLPAGPIASPTARRIVSAQLSAWGLEDLTDDANQVVSELVANAEQHAAGGLDLHVQTTDECVCLEVSDRGGNGVPESRQAAVLDVGGRGLAIVEQLSRAWGWRVAASGKVVWAELSLPARSA